MEYPGWKLSFVWRTTHKLTRYATTFNDWLILVEKASTALVWTWQIPNSQLRGVRIIALGGEPTAEQAMTAALNAAAMLKELNDGSH